MNVVFPFGFPAATAFYLTLFVLTFVLHHIFMHYVLAGTLYVAWATFYPGRHPTPRVEQPLAAVLRDWMPFLLSAAITAGIAPLLFIQIVYQHQFYTANLLLWWRWMVVVPVLIIAFYLLYVLKSSMPWRWPYAVRITVATATALCFVFVGFCWTVNHLLASSGSHWPEVYATGKLPIAVAIVISRMLVWIGGSFATMSAMVGWQLWYQQKQLERQADRNELHDTDSHDVKTLAGMSVGGLVIAMVGGIANLAQSDFQTRSLVFSGLLLPYIFVTVIGVVVQGIGWRLQWRSNKLRFDCLMIVTTGAVGTLFGVSVIREGIRIAAIDLASLVQRHSDAASVGGFGVFLVATILVGVTIAWCVRLVQRGVVA